MQIRLMVTRTENQAYFGVEYGAVVNVDIEDYLCGVVAAEVGEATMEAAKAQAIASRTLAMLNIKTTLTDESSKFQAFRASRIKWPVAVQAVRETAGKVLHYGGKVLRTCSFSASNNGRTTSSEKRWGGYRPYLIEQDDPWTQAAIDALAAKGKSYRKGHGVGLSQIGAAHAASVLGKSCEQILAFYYTGANIVTDYGEGGPARMANHKTAAGLVAWAKEWQGERYWFGTCCYVCSTTLLNSKKKQYPSHYKDSRMARYKKDIAEKRRCADCVGLIKGYLWWDEERQKAVYGFQGARDVGASGMYSAATTKGPINTLPEIPGALVWRSGHIGVYIGGGKVIEARGFDYGVVETVLAQRDFTNWCLCPWVDYEELPDFDDGPGPSPAIPPTVRKGNTGGNVRKAQELLVQHGATIKVDSIFGPLTDAAVRDFQRGKDLVVDGIVGPKTWTELMREETKPREPENPEERYTVIIAGIDGATMRQIVALYPDATVTAA